MSPFMSTLQTAGDAVEETWRLMEVPPLWVVVLILIPGAFGVAYLAYWRESISRAARWTMVTLRALSLLLLLVVLARPVHVRQQQNVIAPEVLLLFDDSGSIDRKSVV